MHPLLEYLAVDYQAVWSICNPKIFLENLDYLTKQWDLNLIIILTLIKEGERVKDNEERVKSKAYWGVG